MEYCCLAYRLQDSANCLRVMVSHGIVTVLSLQDYQSFFEALETEELFEYLKIEIPKEEVEYIMKNAPKEEVYRKHAVCQGNLYFCTIAQFFILIFFMHHSN